MARERPYKKRLTLDSARNFPQTWPPLVEGVAPLLAPQRESQRWVVGTPTLGRSTSGPAQTRAGSQALGLTRARGRRGWGVEPAPRSASSGGGQGGRGRPRAPPEGLGAGLEGGEGPAAPAPQKGGGRPRRGGPAGRLLAGGGRPRWERVGSGCLESPSVRRAHGRTASRSRRRASSVCR